MMGRVWGIDAGMDLFAMSQYSNITSISESPVQEDLLYVGTDDGLIQVSEDGGKNWRKVDKIYGIPEYSFVNDIKADRHDADKVYACLDNHKKGDYKPYLVMSDDRGKTWKSMVGDLPERHLVWRIEQDHVKPELFFLGTEYGLFVSINSGENWLKLSAGAPTIPFRDLAIQKRENDLVGATFGRGFYVLDDYSPLRELTEELVKESEFHIFPVRKALRYVQADKLGGSKGWQGDSFFTAPNPEFGATFTYYVRDEMKTKKQKRKEKEKKIAKDGGDVPIPSWEELEKEENEIAPKIFFEITDNSNQTVARVDGSTAKGMHRKTWNLRFTGQGFGPMVAPGDYTVQGYKIVDGDIEKFGNAQNFEVISVGEPSLKPQKPEKIIAFQKEIGKLRDAIRATSTSLDEASERLEEMQRVLKSHPNGTADLIKQALQLEKELKALDVALNGNELKSDRSEQDVPSVGSRVSSVLFGSMRSTYGFTQTQRDQIDIAIEDFDEVSEEAKQLLEIDLKVFEDQLDEAGIPWTKGRAIPDLK